MAAFHHVRDMNDVALRPRLLRTVLRELLPDDKRQLGSPSQLSQAISMLKTHSLLSETSDGGRTDQKVRDAWKSAVDSWLDRLSQLVSNDMPDKCWAGICLLGVTFQECSADRFLASYTVWFQNLLSHIQSTAASHFVKVASCASISDLLTRLGGFPHIKKDGTALAGRVIQPVLKLLSDDQSEAIWDGAVHLLCNIITFFPYSISRHYDSVEAAIASKILSGNCSFNMLKKLAHCLALLPKSRGDEESWSLMMQKIFLRINNHLNDAFQGFEEDDKSYEAVRLLVTPGKALPSPFGKLTMSGEQSNERTRPESLPTSTVSALMLCCCTMLTSSYPVQVTVPVRSLLALVERVLMVDGSLPNSQRSFMTAMQQEFLSSELPVLHQYSLELLTAVIKGVRSQLLPHAASIVRLLSIYFKRCELPELRIKIYSISKILLVSMGVGMAMCLAEEVVNNAFVDLSPVDFESTGTSSSANPKPSSEALSHPGRKKRKHGATTGSLEEGRETNDFEVGALKNQTTTLISLRIAALEALEALLTVGGALRSEGWRSNLDLLLINMTRNSLKGAWANEERNICHASEPSEVWANVQLAALRALLASFLSSRVRSPYLAQGLALFREGKQETGSKLAEFCAHALLALEVLIHPRVLSVDDFPTANCASDGQKFPENIYSGNLNYNNPFSSGMQGMGHAVLDSDLDDLCESWLENGKETEATVSNPIETMKYNENPSEALAVNQEIQLSGEGFDKEALQVANAATERHGGGDEIMVEANQIPESLLPDHDPVSAKASLAPETAEGSRGIQTSFERITADIGSSKEAGNDIAADQDAFVAKKDGFATAGTSATMVPEKHKEFAYEIDNDSDAEEFPDIVEADPDSDYE